MTHNQNQSIQLDSGIKLHYDEHGKRSNPALALIHGLGSNRKAWNKIIPLLEKEFRIINIDLPKFLDTDDNSLIGIESYADMIYGLVQDLNLENIALCGHSMGAQVAVRFALKYPTHTDPLILLAPAGIETFTEQDYKWFEAFVNPRFYQSLTDEQIEKHFNINFRGTTMPADARFMYEDRLAIRSDSSRYSKYIDYTIKAVFAMLDEPVYDELTQLKTPTLLLYGEEDLLIPHRILHGSLTTRDIMEKASIIPGLQSSMVQEAGHFLLWDQPKIISEKIIEFYKTLK